MLTTKFETLIMLDEESLSKFYTKLCEITNKAFTLSEKYSDAKLVRKI